MQTTPTTIRRLSVPGTMLLVFALLFAQWLGLAHRIEHAGLQQLAWQAQGNLSVTHSDTKFDKTLDHSCSLFDGATLSSVLNSPFIVPAILPNPQVLAQWVAFASWDAPFLRHFSSRAPPAA